MDREKRQSLRSVARVIVVWTSEAVGLVLMIRFVPGLRFDSWGIGILVVGVIALLNAILWPILSKIALPFLFFTFGIGALALNGLIVWLSSVVVPGFHVEGWALILVPIGIAVINTAVSGILQLTTTHDISAQSYCDMQNIPQRLPRQLNLASSSWRLTAALSLSCVRLCGEGTCRRLHVG